MTDLRYVLLLLLAGGYFAAHCSRATLNEFRNGLALAGIFGDHDRAGSPVAFWIIMICNAAAAVMGAIFFVFGVLYGATDLGWF